MKVICIPEQYEQIKTIWQNNISMLKEKPVCLVHYSPFPWTIYISETESSYQVSKITALGDVIWWDAETTVAHILYPPFFAINDDLRRAFLDGYKKDINKKCVSLYVSCTGFVLGQEYMRNWILTQMRHGVKTVFRT